MQALLGSAQVGVEKLAPALATEWEVYAASDTQPKLTQTVWLLQRVASSLVTELITPAMQQCTAVLQPEPPAPPLGTPPGAGTAVAAATPGAPAQVASGGAVAPLPAGETREVEGFGPVRPPRSRGTEPFPTLQAGADLDLDPAQGATAKPAVGHPVFVAAGGRHNG